MNAYRKLEERFARLQVLRETEAILQWDRATMMPAGAASGRAEQIAAQRLVCHDILTDPRLGQWLDEAEAGRRALDPWQAANLAAMAREWRHANALEPDLVAALARAETRCEMAWRDARPADDFERVLPQLSEVLNLVRQAAAAKAEALNLSRYDALLDRYEPGMRAAEIDKLFGELAAFLPDFIERAIAHQARQKPALPLSGPFAVDDQRRLGQSFMAALGFDFDHGRLDVSLHPFCGGTSDDVRITTRYDADDFARSLMGVLHETGHALYEQGLPKDWRHQPVGQVRSMGLHESQSLFVEMQICRSPEFLTYAAPLIRRAFNRDGPAWEDANLRRHYLRVERGFIRVDADEATYPAHIILRYRLERAMIDGALAAADLPTAWNEAMVGLLGIRPPSDREGCLQDIHWYGGDWGYFPTYTLGAMTAAQLFQALGRSQPGIVADIARGQFAPALAWLRSEVHAKAGLLSIDELLGEVTGSPLDTRVFTRHLTARYLY